MALQLAGGSEVTDLDAESSFGQTTAYGCCENGVDPASLIAFLAGRISNQRKAGDGQMILQNNMGS